MHQYYINGTKISLTNNNKVLDLIRSYNFSQSNYICIFGLLELLQSFTNAEFQNALNSSYLNPLHSRWIEFYLNRKRIRNVKALDPIWFFKQILNEDFTHYFYGSNDQTLSKVKSKIQCEFPKTKIIGYKAAPYLKLDEIKNNDKIRRDIESIKTQKPDIIWIGIGGWKQDLLMHYFFNYLDRGLMIGVGAVFDLYVGNIKTSPLWMKRVGLRWLYYLIQQPIYRTSKLLNLFYAIIKGKLKINKQ